MAKKNTTITLTELLDRFERDILTDDIRLLCVIGGYYLDFLLEKNIEKLIKKPNSFTTNLSFSNRVSMLESLGFFDIPPVKANSKNIFASNKLFSSSEEDVLNDIVILNSIRNYFAHNILEDIDTLPNEIKSKIGKLYLSQIVTDKPKNDKEVIRYSFNIAFSFLLSKTDLYDSAIVVNHFFKTLEENEKRNAKKKAKKK